MDKTLKTILLVLGAVVVVVGLILTGVIVNRLVFRSAISMPFNHWAMMGWFYDEDQTSFGPGMMYQNYSGDENEDAYFYGRGMMYQDDSADGTYYGPGMMWNHDYDSETCPYADEYGYSGRGMMWNSGAYGCSGYQGYNGMYGGGMMGGYWQSDADLPLLSIEEVESAVLDYLDNAEDLHIGEIMIFSNHAYVQVLEESTGIGAFELLIDPTTLNVYQEYGPNMMWNLKYGMHGNSSYSLEDVSISEDDAIAAAQAYLDNFVEGYEAEEHAVEFYGYYTLHYLEDGEVAGMLSVNSFSGDVFLHTWHGDFIEMTAEH